MRGIYNEILSAKKHNQQLLAILLDPDKIDWEQLEILCQAISKSPATHIFVGGSQVFTDRIDELILEIKDRCHLPVVLFPGNPSQISNQADGILLLSLLSGRNPDFLIGHHVQAANALKNSGLEIIPTAYLLIESGSQTAVSRVSKTNPMDCDKIDAIVSTAIAGEMLGNQLVYLEAGSGAQNAVASRIISQVSKNIQIPLIVGGGIRSRDQINAAFHAGANLVVIGTAFENDPHFFDNE